MNQSINQSTNQPTYQSTRQSINQSLNEPSKITSLLGTHTTSYGKTEGHERLFTIPNGLHPPPWLVDGCGAADATCSTWGAHESKSPGFPRNRVNAPDGFPQKQLDARQRFLGAQVVSEQGRENGSHRNGGPTTVRQKTLILTIAGDHS